MLAALGNKLRQRQARGKLRRIPLHLVINACLRERRRAQQIVRAGRFSDSIVIDFFQNVVQEVAEYHPAQDVLLRRRFHIRFVRSRHVVSEPGLVVGLENTGPVQAGEGANANAPPGQILVDTWEGFYVEPRRFRHNRLLRRLPGHLACRRSVAWICWLDERHIRLVDGRGENRYDRPLAGIGLRAIHDREIQLEDRPRQGDVKQPALFRIAFPSVGLLGVAVGG